MHSYCSANNRNLSLLSMLAGCLAILNGTINRSVFLYVYNHAWTDHDMLEYRRISDPLILRVERLKKIPFTLFIPLSVAMNVYRNIICIT